MLEFVARVRTLAAGKEATAGTQGHARILKRSFPSSGQRKGNAVAGEVRSKQELEGGEDGNGNEGSRGYVEALGLWVIGLWVIGWLGDKEAGTKVDVGFNDSRRTRRLLEGYLLIG